MKKRNFQRINKKYYIFKKNFPETFKFLLRQRMVSGPFNLGLLGQVKFYVFETFK